MIRSAKLARLSRRRLLAGIPPGLLAEPALANGRLTVQLRHRGLLLGVGRHAYPSDLWSSERVDDKHGSGGPAE